MRRSHKILIFILIFALAAPVFIYISAARFYAFDIGFYTHEFDKYSPDADDPALAASGVISFLEGRSDNSSLSMFSGREISHLEDVRILVNKFLLALYASAMILAASIILMYYSDSRRFLRNIAFASGSGGIFTIILSIVSYFLLSDFRGAFTGFHKLLFAGNWSFPPDFMLIRLFPEQFWIDMAHSIMAFVLISANILILAGVILFTISKIREKRRGI